MKRIAPASPSDGFRSDLSTEVDNVAARTLYERLGGDAEQQVLYTFALTPGIVQ